MVAAAQKKESQAADAAIMALLRLLLERPLDAAELGRLQALPPARLAHWLKRHGLEGLAAERLQATLPALADALRLPQLLLSGENSVHLALLDDVLDELAAEGIDAVLVKGAALIFGVYHQLTARTMSDIDLLLRQADFERALQRLAGAGYESKEKQSRPVALQLLADGEVQLVHPQRPHNLVELHLSPFKGWWLKRTAAVDNEKLWRRIEPLAVGERRAYQLAVEDALIHYAVHNGVNHQFGLHAVRAMIDTAVTTDCRAVDWAALAVRARNWRVATVVWLHLWLTDQIVGLPAAQSVLIVMQPPRWQRRLLQRLLPVAELLAGQDMRKSRKRLLLLLLLIDRKRDVLRLLWRTIWPERAWLEARYGRPKQRWRHLWRVVRSQEV